MFTEGVILTTPNKTLSHLPLTPTSAPPKLKPAPPSFVPAPVVCNECGGRGHASHECSNHKVKEFCARYPFYLFLKYFMIKILS